MPSPTVLVIGGGLLLLLLAGRSRGAAAESEPSEPPTPPAPPWPPAPGGTPPAPWPPAPGGTPPAPGGTPPAPGGTPPAPGGTPPAPGGWKLRQFVDGHPADPTLPDSAYNAQNEVLARQDLDASDAPALAAAASTLSSQGFPLAAFCMRLHAQSIAQPPDIIYSPTQAIFADGCPIDNNFPPNFVGTHNAILLDPNLSYDDVRRAADSEAALGYPLASSCLYRNAAERAAR